MENDDFSSLFRPAAPAPSVQKKGQMYYALARSPLRLPGSADNVVASLKSAV